MPRWCAALCLRCPPLSFVAFDFELLDAFTHHPELSRGGMRRSHCSAGSGVCRAPAPTGVWTRETACRVVAPAERREVSRTARAPARHRRRAPRPAVSPARSVSAPAAAECRRPARPAPGAAARWRPWPPAPPPRRPQHKPHTCQTGPRPAAAKQGGARGGQHLALCRQRLVHLLPALGVELLQSGAERALQLHAGLHRLRLRLVGVVRKSLGGRGWEPRARGRGSAGTHHALFVQLLHQAVHPRPHGVILALQHLGSLESCLQAADLLVQHLRAAA